MFFFLFVLCREITSVRPLFENPSSSLNAEKQKMDSEQLSTMEASGGILKEKNKQVENVLREGKKKLGNMIKKNKGQVLKIKYRSAVDVEWINYAEEDVDIGKAVNIKLREYASRLIEKINLKTKEFEKIDIACSKKQHVQWIGSLEKIIIRHVGIFELWNYASLLIKKLNMCEKCISTLFVSCGDKDQVEWIGRREEAEKIRIDGVFEFVLNDYASLLIKVLALAEEKIGTLGIICSDSKQVEWISKEKKTIKVKDIDVLGLKDYASQILSILDVAEKSIGRLAIYCSSEQHVEWMANLDSENFSGESMVKKVLLKKNKIFRKVQEKRNPVFEKPRNMLQQIISSYNNMQRVHQPRFFY